VQRISNTDLMPVQIPPIIRDVMETPKTRILRRKSSKSKKVNTKSTTKVSTAPVKSPTNIAKIAPMPIIMNPSKRRYPSDEVLDEGRISPFTESAANSETMEFRRRNPSSSTKSTCEALLQLKDSARIFKDSAKVFNESQKTQDEIVSPFLRLPKSVGNSEISNVSNISHIFSSPKLVDQAHSNSDTECAKIENRELSYPPPCKRPKSADSQIKPEDFLTVKDFAKEIKSKRNDYQAQIDRLKAQNDEMQVRTKAFETKMDDFKVISEDVKTKSLPTKTLPAQVLSLLALLQCTSCEQLPKNDISRPNIFGCSNGHLICQNCVDIVEKCPKCSEKEVKNKQAFAETILNKIFPAPKPNTKCRFDICKAEMKTVEDLKDHEKFCIYRTVPCPSKHRGACNWNGPLSKLLEHCKEKQCVQVAFDDTFHNSNNVSLSTQNVAGIFKSNLGDFPSTEKSVFERNDVTTHWKPTLLLSKSKLINLWCHVVIQRDASGNWKLIVYSMLPKNVAEKIRVKITVGNPDTGRSFNFSGNLTSYETSMEQAIQEGNFLHLHDVHVKPFKQLCSSKNTLFDYTIEVDAEAKLISFLHLRSQRISMNNSATVIEKKIQITDRDIPKMPKLTPKPVSKLLPKPAATFNVTFDNSSDGISSPKFNVQVKMEPSEVNLD